MIKHSTAQRITKIVPFQEPVTYFQRTSGDTFSAPITVARARRKKVDLSDTSFSPELLAVANLVWEITAEYIPVAPVTDDYLVDSTNVKWIPIGVTTQFNGQVFLLLCKQGVN